MRRRNIAGGLVLVLLGALFLLWQLAPDNLKETLLDFISWPFFVIVPGLIFILISIVSGVGGLAIPGSIITGVGLMLWYQNVTGDWLSWSYGWILINAFVGFGILLGGIISPEMREGRRVGLIMFVISTLVTLIFWAAFHSKLVSSTIVWAAILILLGGYLLVSAFLRRR